MVQELDKFRSKYPEYGDLDDSSLAGMLSKKYPDAYGDLPGKVIQPITGIGPPWWVGPGRTAATTIGMIGGGLAGGGAGLFTGPAAPVTSPLLVVAGAGLGGSGMGQMYDRALELTGVTRPQSPLRSAITAGMEVAEFGAAEATGGIISKPFNWLLGKLPWAGKGLTQESKRVSDILKAEGIDAPGPVITGNKSQMALYQTAGNMPTSSGTIEKEVSKAWEQIGTQTERAVTSKGLNVSPYQAGTTAQTGESLLYQRTNAQGKALHQRFINLGKRTPIELTKTNEVGKEIIESDVFDLLPGDLQNSIKTIFSKTTMDIPASQSTILNVTGRPAVSTPSRTVSVTRTLDKVDELRKALNENAGYEGLYADKVQSLHRRISSALDDDILISTQKTNPAAHAAFRAEKDFYSKEIFGKFKGLDIYKQKAMGEKLLTQDPSTVLKEANTVVGLKKMKEVMPEKYFDTVRRGKIAEIIEPAFKEIDTASGKVRILDGDTLSKNVYKNLAPEYRVSLFKPDELKALDNVITSSQSMKALNKYGGSQSGTPKGQFYGRMLELSPAPAGAGVGYLVGGVPGLVIGSTLGYMTPYGVAKFLTSEMGKRYLIEGVKVGAKTKLGATMGGLGMKEFTSPSYNQMAEDIMKQPIRQGD